MASLSSSSSSTSSIVGVGVCDVGRQEFKSELPGGALLDNDAKCRVCHLLAGQHSRKDLSVDNDVLNRFRSLSIASESHQPQTLSSRVEPSVCSSLRQSLRDVFHEEKVDGDDHSRWIDLSEFTSPIGQVFGRPKDLRLASPLLWTAQTECLWQELTVEPDGDQVRAQILAGPSGIGKSHLTFLLALRAYAEGNPVLYISDAGDFYSNPGENGLMVSLMQQFFDSNIDKFSSDESRPVATWREFMQWLTNAQAIVIIDEHGHAYREIKTKKQNPSEVFPLLMPNSYLQHKLVRMVFAGSNQASFECDLNDTYRPCLRFIQPFADVDATLFCASVAGSHHDLETHRRFANFVPRQMLLLSQHQDSDAYIKQSKEAMLNKLRQTLSNLSDMRQGLLRRTLDDLFHLSSMALGIENLSLLDLGYVYRQRRFKGGRLLAFPLCYPATVALLQLWHDISMAPSERLVDIKRGADFEQLAWDVLLSRGFGIDGVILNGLSLGYDAEHPSAHVTVLQFSFNEYFISNVSAPNQGKGRGQLKSEIGKLVKRAQELGICILYKCPDDCKAFDFAILQANDEHYVIQVSLSELTAHSRNGKEPRQDMICNEFGLVAKQYLYITRSPNPHQGIVAGVAGNNAKYDRWKGHDAFIRLVDANAWIGM